MIKLFVFSHSLSDFGGTPKGAHDQIKYLDRSLFDITYLAFEDGFRRQLLEKDGIGVHTGNQQQLVEYCTQSKPDIIHLHRHGADSDGLLPFIQGIRPHCKKLIETNVFGIHGPVAEKYFDHHIFIADFALSRVLSVASPTYKGEVLYFNYDLNKYEVPQRPKRSVLRIGRHSRNTLHKWHPTCIDSALLLKDAGVVFEYHVLGIPTEYKERLIAKGIQVVDYPNTSDSDNVRNLLENLDIFIHGSVIGELHPSGIVEAFASGLPVITLDSGHPDTGHVQFVQQSGGGKVVSSVVEYKDAIMSLLDFETRNAIGQSGYQWVHSFFNQKKLTTQYTQILLKL